MKQKHGINQKMSIVQKYALYISLFYSILTIATGSAIAIKSTRYASSSVYQMRLTSESKTRMNRQNSIPFLSSGQRKIDYQQLERKRVIDLSKEDYENLLKIVEAEAGCEDDEGKLLVANVVINRVQDEAFPDTVTGVIYQREQGVTQFSPISNGRFQQVKVSESTIKVVERALCGENHAESALYFAARDYAEPDRMKWFDENLTFLFSHGGHEFYK
ncbi:MAG: cell wall hydrolase [Lachnospiraceae bacterium]|nr:cell wall hydrolase [Lachnospiraceae bacterium]